MTIFGPANIQLPAPPNLEKWPVIACDQYTSQPEFWTHLRSEVGNAPSTLHMILPEAELSRSIDQKCSSIHQTMMDYAHSGILETYSNSFVYVERTLANGCIRPGIVGVVDLESYDYRPGSTSPIRATEKTVAERIPPRRAVRQHAALDMSHVLLLADDEENALFRPLAGSRDRLKPLYSLDLMGNGGHIAGWLVDGADADALLRRIMQYESSMRSRYSSSGGGEIVYVIGDGNHSLAAAKDCYEQAKKEHPNSVHCPRRYALVELENIHDPAQQFEPIHRLVQTSDPQALLKALELECGANDGYPVTWYLGNTRGVLHLDRSKALTAIAVLQPFLDAYIQEWGGGIDYIHGGEVLCRLAAEKNALGFLLPPVEKGHFFQSILSNGVLPRKTFSMGHAQEKRYYLETRAL